MTQILSLCPPSHKVAVLFGADPVAAYLAGETRRERLEALGLVQNFSFGSLPEMNAFLYGIEVAAGYDDVLAVDDLS